MKRIAFLLCFFPVLAAGELVWDEPQNDPDVAGFNLYRCEYDIFAQQCTDWGSPLNSIPISVVGAPTFEGQYDDTTVTPNVNYMYEVRSVNANGLESAGSNIATIIQYARPTAPTNLRVQ